GSRIHFFQRKRCVSCCPSIVGPGWLCACLPCPTHHPARLLRPRPCSGRPPLTSPLPGPIQQLGQPERGRVGVDAGGVVALRVAGGAGGLARRRPSLLSSLPATGQVPIPAATCARKAPAFARCCPVARRGAVVVGGLLRLSVYASVRRLPVLLEVS